MPTPMPAFAAAEGPLDEGEDERPAPAAVADADADADAVADEASEVVGFGLSRVAVRDVITYTDVFVTAPSEAVTVTGLATVTVVAGAGAGAVVGSVVYDKIVLD